MRFVKSLSLRHQVRSSMKIKTKVEENLEARELIFNIYSVNSNMHYIDEETDLIVENVGIDAVDLFDLLSNIEAFIALD